VFFWVPCSNFHVKIVEKRQKCLSNSDNSGYSIDNQRDIDGILHGMFVIHFWILKFIDFFKRRTYCSRNIICNISPEETLTIFM